MAASFSTAWPVIGTSLTLSTISKLLPRSASDWMSELPISGSSEERFHGDPFVVEFPDVVVRMCHIHERPARSAKNTNDARIRISREQYWSRAKA